MPRDSSGIFNPLISWVADKLAGVPFSPERFDAQDSDFAAALNDLPLKKNVPTFVSASVDPTTVNPGSFSFSSGTFQMVVNVGGQNQWFNVTTGTPVDLTNYWTSSTTATAISTAVSNAVSGLTSTYYTQAQINATVGTLTSAITSNTASVIAAQNTANSAQSTANSAASTASAALPASQVGVAGGAASLDGGGHVPVAQLPSIPYSQISGSPSLTSLALTMTNSQRVVGRNSASGGASEEVTVDQLLDWVTGTAAWGDVIYRGTGGYRRLPAGTGYLKSNGVGADVSWGVPGSYVGCNLYTSSQSVTIPAGATRARVILIGGGGGTSSAGGCCAYSLAGLFGGVCVKTITGLTPGSTMTLTVGAFGASGGNGNAGGSTMLTSGTQTISSMTAGGGNGGSAPYIPAGSTPASTTGGDINLNGNGTVVAGPLGSNYGSSGKAGAGYFEWYA